MQNEFFIESLRVSTEDFVLSSLSPYPLGEATADGAGVLWIVPHILSMLVSGAFRDKGVRMAVDGQMLSRSEIKERGFKMNLREGRVEVRVPLGGDGGLLKVIKRKAPCKIQSCVAVQCYR